MNRYLANKNKHLTGTFYWIAIFLIITPLTSAQKKISIDGFSEKYHAIIHLNENYSEPDYRDGVGYLSLYEQNKEQELFRVSMYEVRDQPFIHYEDFNFDGKKDFAIRNGYASCYGGPSYTIYLASGDTFVNDPDFNKLIDDYCGLFSVDHTAKTLHATRRTGNGLWYSVSTFKIKENKPVLTEIYESERRGLLSEVETITTWNEKGEKEVRESYTAEPEYLKERLQEVEESPPFYFTLESGHTIILFETEGYLRYLYTDENYSVESFYPSQLLTPQLTNDKFRFQQKDGVTTLTFSDAGSTYTIYETDKTVGINRVTPEEKVTMKGIKSSQSGTLGTLFKQVPQNIQNIDYQ